MKRFNVHINANGTPFLNGVKGKKIAQGGDRTAYKCRRYVVKVSTRTGYRTQNRIEWDNYQAMPTRLRRYFARVYAMGESQNYSYVVQAYVRASRKHCKISYAAQVRDIAQRSGVTDIHRDNWMVTSNGRIQIVDIGYDYLRKQHD